MGSNEIHCYLMNIFLNLKYHRMLPLNLWLHEYQNYIFHEMNKQSNLISYYFFKKEYSDILNEDNNRNSSI